MPGIRLSKVKMSLFSAIFNFSLKYSAENTPPDLTGANGDTQEETTPGPEPGRERERGNRGYFYYT